MRFRGTRSFRLQKLLSRVVRNCSGSLSESHSKANEVSNAILPLLNAKERTSKSFSEFNNKLQERRYYPVNIPAEILNPVSEFDEDADDDECGVEGQAVDEEPEKKQIFYHNCVVIKIRNQLVIDKIRKIQEQLENYDDHFKYVQMKLNSLHITLLWICKEVREEIDDFEDHVKRTEECLIEAAEILRCQKSPAVNLTIEGVETLGKVKEKVLCAKVRQDEHWGQILNNIKIIEQILVKRNVTNFTHLREKYFNTNIYPHVTFQRTRITKKDACGKNKVRNVVVPQEYYDAISKTYFGVETVRSFELFISKKLPLDSPVRRKPLFSCDFVSVV